MEFKRGATFRVRTKIRVKAGSLGEDGITGWQGRSEIRDVAGAHIATANVEVLDGPNLEVELLVTGPTDAWSIGAADIDIRFETPAGDVVYTETVRFVIIEPPTRGAHG